MKLTARYTILLTIFVQFSVLAQQAQIKIGAEQIDRYIPLLKDKKVGVVVNHTSVFDDTHLVDTLLGSGVEVLKVFAPEHGFRGKADAGEALENGIDTKTGLPIISLYGSNKKPTPEQLADLDVVIFDIQDVGVRFYTYISTMHYVMEACAENKKKLIVLDRPNPNGSYVAGPVLDLKFQSFVGMHAIPIVHGLTIGELAKMINHEGWLNAKVKCDVTIVSCQNYTHAMSYSLPIKPSPNLPSDVSIRMYPSLCLFEPTVVSVGRGTYQPFEIIGMPDSSVGNYSFTPQSIVGMSKHPKHEGVTCYGIDFNKEENPPFTVAYLVDLYKIAGEKDDFFTSENFFNKLAGTDQLIAQVKAGWSAKQIEDSWNDDLEAYKILRARYLLYPLQ